MKKEYLHGKCPEHPVQFVDGKGVVEVAKSTIEGAGQGVFNTHEKDTIPVGTMFGPYTGKFIKKANYKKESGFGWELNDEVYYGKVIGVVDPGTKPDPERDWLAYVNSACYLWQQNIVAVQYQGEIWYRVVQPIAPGEELLTHYGEAYSKTLGIDKNFRLTKEEVAALNARVAKEASKVKEVKKNKARGKSGLGSNPSFVPHAAKVRLVVPSGDSTTAPAGATRMMGALAKDRTLAFFNCADCQAVFGHPVGLENHIKWNSKKGEMKCGKEKAKRDPNKEKKFQCKTCDKSFSSREGKHVHEKTAHSGVRYKCETCDKVFKQKSSMERHLRTVHAQGYVLA